VFIGVEVYGSLVVYEGECRRMRAGESEGLTRGIGVPWLFRAELAVAALVGGWGGQWVAPLR
jgi:hypothetical protein